MKPPILPLNQPGWPPSPDLTRTATRAAIDDAASAPPVSRWTRARARLLKLSPKQRRYQRIISQQGASWAANAWPEIFAAWYVGLELAVACTTTQLESSGRNIYGSDPASAWMNQSPWGVLWEMSVTRENYLWFGSHVDEGFVSNGVGPKQLTSRSLQKAADVRGGCYVPEHNCAEGDVFFLELLRQTGSIWGAAYAYNGSGSPAVAYANEFVSLVAEWRQRLV